MSDEKKIINPASLAMEELPNAVYTTPEELQRYHELISNQQPEQQQIHEQAKLALGDIFTEELYEDALNVFTQTFEDDNYKETLITLANNLQTQSGKPLFDVPIVKMFLAVSIYNSPKYNGLENEKKWQIINYVSFYIANSLADLNFDKVELLALLNCIQSFETYLQSIKNGDNDFFSPQTVAASLRVKIERYINDIYGSLTAS